MPLTLSYLPLRARAEPLRMILAYCAIDYTDTIVSFDDWGTLKESGTVPPGRTGNVQLPVLELEDGTMMPESLDIAKYIWTTLAGKPVTGSDPENLWLLNDATDAPFNSPDFPRAGMVNPYLNWIPEEACADKIGPLIARFPAFFEHVAPLLAEAPAGPFFGGAEPNFGDFQIFHVTNNLCLLDGGATLSALKATQPDIVAWYNAVLALPAVAAYLAARPQPGTGEIGRPGSLILKYTAPHEVARI
jgi:glutathione S-transferase